MHRSVWVSAAFAIFLCIVTLSLARAIRRQRRRERVELSDLLARIQPFSRTGIEEVAADILDPSLTNLDVRSDTRLKPIDIWDLVGGIEGIEVLLKNAEVLIDLAYYVRQWNEDAAAVAEQLRLEANDIRRDLRHLRRTLRMQALMRSVGIRSGGWRIAVHAQRAAATYCLMTRQLLVLFELSNVGLVGRLREAL